MLTILFYAYMVALDYWYSTQQLGGAPVLCNGAMVNCCKLMYFPHGVYSIYFLQNWCKLQTIPTKNKTWKVNLEREPKHGR